MFTNVRYAWIPVAIVYFILLGQGVHQRFYSAPMGSGSYEAGSVLSFVSSTSSQLTQGCVLVGGALGWALFASDYNVNMPEDTKSWKVLVYVFTGLTVPTVLIMCLGAAFGA